MNEQKQFADQFASENEFEEDVNDLFEDMKQQKDSINLLPKKNVIEKHPMKKTKNHFEDEFEEDANDLFEDRSNQNVAINLFPKSNKIKKQVPKKAQINFENEFEEDTDEKDDLFNDILELLGNKSDSDEKKNQIPMQKKYVIKTENEFEEDSNEDSN